MPDVALTTDIIVGFPGETDEDFEATLAVVDEVGYDSAFTFIFSPRRGTRAADLPDDLSPDVKRARMARLVERVQAWRPSARSAVGRKMEVLVEGPSRTDPEPCGAGSATTRRSTSPARRSRRARGREDRGGH